MQTNNPFNNTINTLNERNKEVDKFTRKIDEEMKEDYNKNEENDNPAFILYNSITKTSIELLQSESAIETFKKIESKIGEDATKSMIEMFAIMLTQSSYDAVLTYDSLLKKELDKQFDHFAEHLNIAKADIEAHQGALTVFRKQLNEIQTKLEISKIKNENNIK